MLFDIVPKTSMSDIFDRTEEFGDLKLSIENSPLTVIYGIRRSGKTSLLRSGLNEMKIPYIFIDMRKIFSENGMIRDTIFSREVFNLFYKNLNIFRKLGISIKNLPDKIK